MQNIFINMQKNGIYKIGKLPITIGAATMA